MPLRKLRDFLDRNNVKYVSISHSPAFTAQEIAASAHVPGGELAKTVMVRLDRRMHMAVLPASRRVDLQPLKLFAEAETIELATEDEFISTFPDCELGAMPPFGNLYGMEVFVARELAEDERIAFNAGSHTELIRLDFDDFKRLVKPRIGDFSCPFTRAVEA